ncbi:MAG: protoheme IX farnesyltransferase [Alphaproteobacteria bacterium]|nr:protoheme IX farnesyltransferase [Alphaproteobacteria bacterium]
MTDLSLQQTGSYQAASDPNKGMPPVASLHDFITVLKPRVMSLVVFTGFAGLLAAPGSIHPFLGAVAVLCIAIAAGAAGAINMWYDRDIDAVMSRTAKRPIPQGRIDADTVLAYGLILTVFSVMIMGLAVNWMAASLLAGASAFYILIYPVWLKRRTPQNIVIGGAAGAFPPMIGWAAVTGDVSLTSLALFCIIFFWTPPHFWALALFKRDDYASVNIPMLPVVAGEAETKRQMVLYTALLLPISLAPVFLGHVGLVYGAATTVLGLMFLGHALRVWRVDGQATGYRAAKKMFLFSIMHLFLIFAALILDRVVAALGYGLMLPPNMLIG